MSYEVKGVKGFMGRDCPGYNATLYRDGVKIATVVNDGSGGEERIDWEDAGRPKMVDGKYVMVGAAPRVEVQTINYKGEPWTMRCTPEEAKLLEFIKGKTYKMPEDLGGKEEPMSVGMFIALLVEAFENTKRFKRLCKTQTLFRIKGDKEGSYRVIKAPYSRQVKDIIVARFGRDKAEVILNETFGQVAV